MRYLLIAAALLASTSAFADERNCFLIDASGNRFQFTDDATVWLFEPTDGTDEFCAYGAVDDPNAAFSVTCEAHKINAPVINGDSQATILDRVWKRVCRNG